MRLTVVTCEAKWFILKQKEQNPVKDAAPCCFIEDKVLSVYFIEA